MTSLADRTIAALRSTSDQLATTVAGLTDDQLGGPSGSSDWSIAQVLSHLGSGAEITLRPLAAAATGTPVPEADNQAVWDRWNASSPRDQAINVLEHDLRLVETLESLDAEERETLTVDLGFLPAPVPLAMAAGMRLNEVALHAWDVEVAFDPAATVDAESAEVLLELFSGPLSMMMAWASKPGAAPESAVVAMLGHGLAIGESVALVAEPPVAPTATFVGDAEAAVRLLSGRLAPEHTPEGVDVTGNVTLDDLRGVFPGY